MNAEDKQILANRADRARRYPQDYTTAELWLIAHLEAEAAEVERWRADRGELHDDYVRLQHRAEAAEQRATALETCLRECRDALMFMARQYCRNQAQYSEVYQSTLARADELLAAKEAIAEAEGRQEGGK